MTDDEVTELIRLIPELTDPQLDRLAAAFERLGDNLLDEAAADLAERFLAK